MQQPSQERSGTKSGVGSQALRLVTPALEHPRGWDLAILTNQSAKQREGGLRLFRALQAPPPSHYPSPDPPIDCGARTERPQTPRAGQQELLEGTSSVTSTE